MSDDDDTTLEVARIEIVRTLGAEGDVVWVEAVDNNGGRLAIVESLGMLRLAEDTIMRQAMGEIDACSTADRRPRAAPPPPQPAPSSRSDREGAAPSPTSYGHTQLVTLTRSPRSTTHAQRSNGD